MSHISSRNCNEEVAHVRVPHCGSLKCLEEHHNLVALLIGHGIRVITESSDTDIKCKRCSTKKTTPPNAKLTKGKTKVSTGSGDKLFSALGLEDVAKEKNNGSGDDDAATAATNKKTLRGKNIMIYEPDYDECSARSGITYATASSDNTVSSNSEVEVLYNENRQHVESRQRARSRDNTRQRARPCDNNRQRSRRCYNVRKNEDDFDEEPEESESENSDSESSASDTSENLYSLDPSQLTVIQWIGGGSFGDVYKCRWRGILVAVKCIRDKSNQQTSESCLRDEEDPFGMRYGADSDSDTESDCSDAESDVEDGRRRRRRAPAAAVPSPRVLASFRKEVQIMEKLRHPNVCMLFATSMSKVSNLMVMELMKSSLADILDKYRSRNIKLPKKNMVSYARQIARGMYYLHSSHPPIIHRDLKPSNVLVDFHGNLKISDFGLSKIRPAPGSRLEQYIMTGETGSYRFMAPEVFRGEDYDEKVDVYSFAMVFYNIFAGYPPWPTLSGLKAVTSVSANAVRPCVPKSSDPRFEILIKECWDEDPKQRPSFSAVLYYLDDFSKDLLGPEKDEYHPNKKYSFARLCVKSWVKQSFKNAFNF